LWKQDYDYKRFEKDRVLTSFDYMNARRLGKNFVEDFHSVRGIEAVCDESLLRRQTGERKDLYKALTEEEARQKEEGSFPDLERFRAVSLKHTKAGKERAMAKALEDAKEQQRELRKSVSMKNLFRWSRQTSSVDEMIKLEEGRQERRLSIDSE
jgi:hypothetical protein